jgi:hypothetical protein
MNSLPMAIAAGRRVLAGLGLAPRAVVELAHAGDGYVFGVGGLRGPPTEACQRPVRGGSTGGWRKVDLSQRRLLLLAAGSN